MDTERVNKGLLDCGCGFAMDKEADEDLTAGVAAILSPDCAIHKDQKQVEAYLLERLEKAAKDHMGTRKDVDGAKVTRSDGGVNLEMGINDEVVRGNFNMDIKDTEMDDCTDGDCPICMNWIPTNDKKGEYPGAMSRFDRDEDEPTEICSACGTAEGFILFHLGDDDELRDAMCEDWGLWRAAVLIQRDMLKVRE